MVSPLVARLRCMLVGIVFVWRWGDAHQVPLAGKNVFRLSPLPYSYKSLEPHLGRETVEMHYDRHYRHHVETLNQMLKTIDRLEESSLEEIMLDAYEWNKPLYKNAAETWNHDFYFKSMTSAYFPPSEPFLQRLEENFGNFIKFRLDFQRAGNAVIGSGWVWLIYDALTGDLKITTTSNADNPMTLNKYHRPILAMDVWEHAYCLDFRNSRKNYTEAFIHHLVDWRFVEERLEKLEAEASAEAIELESARLEAEEESSKWQMEQLAVDIAAEAAKLEQATKEAEQLYAAARQEEEWLEMEAAAGTESEDARGDGIDDNDSKSDGSEEGQRATLEISTAENSFDEMSGHHGSMTSIPEEERSQSKSNLEEQGSDSTNEVSPKNHGVNQADTSAFESISKSWGRSEVDGTNGFDGEAKTRNDESSLIGGSSSSYDTKILGLEGENNLKENRSNWNWIPFIGGKTARSASNVEVVKNGGGHGFISYLLGFVFRRRHSSSEDSKSDMMKATVCDGTSCVLAENKTNEVTIKVEMPVESESDREGGPGSHDNASPPKTQTDPITSKPVTQEDEKKKNSANAADTDESHTVREGGLFSKLWRAIWRLLLPIWKVIAFIGRFIGFVYSLG